VKTRAPPPVPGTGCRARLGPKALLTQVFASNRRRRVRANETTARIGLADTATDAVLIAVLLTGAALGLGMWLTGQLAALLFLGRWPSLSPADGLAAALRLPWHLASPRQAWPVTCQASLPGGVIPFAVAGPLSLTGLGTGAFFGIRAARGRKRERGLASRRDLQAALAEKAVIARGPVIRPSLAGTQVTVEDVGIRLGRAIPSRIPLACSGEDSVLVLSAPRQGKTSDFIIPWLHTWPGPALATSIRPDVLLATALPRSRRGPVAVMAPTGMITWPDVLRWDPASGCDSFDVAHARADVMVTVGKTAGAGDSNDGGYFAMNATNLLAAWLHAAALSGGTARDVLKWAFDERDDAPIRILATTAEAADGTAAMLDALYRLPPDTTRASLWTTAQTAVSPLLAPAAREVFLPAPGQAADLAGFLRAGGTCYLMASERRASVLAPIVSAFADDLIETATVIAAQLPGGRLDPGLGLFLDEVANIVPLPQLPALMSFSGGTGIFVAAVFQSMAQARNRWGADAAAMLWGAATVKAILGGLAGDDLREISELAGEYRETVTSWQRGHGGSSLTASLQDRKTLTPDQVRTLSALEREGLIIHATTPAVLTRMTRHYEGPCKDVFAASVKESRRIAGLDAA
jgi:type IV secretion system protein VirD4